jgi:2-hydroxychromene-2-carboxylate isomerase
MKIPFVPPPKETDPTRAGAGSFLAQQSGLLEPYIVEVMREEWEFGKDIGLTEPLLRAATRAGLSAEPFLKAVDDPGNRQVLADSEAKAAADGIFGVPTFMVGTEIFWGNDRLDFLAEHLDELRQAS